MPQVNLSSLSGPELRQMLDSSRRRGEAQLTYQILQEMAARRDVQPERTGVLRMRRPAEPRVVDVDLGDPMDAKDEVPPMPAWRAPPLPPQAQAEPPPGPVSTPAPPKARRGKAGPAPTLADAMAAGVAELDAQPAPAELEPAAPEPAPRSVWDADPEPALHAKPPKAQQRVRGPSGLRRGLAVGFAAGAAAGVALGWWFAGPARSPAAAAPAAPTLQVAALTPPPAPVAPAPAEPAPVSQAPPALAVELATPQVSETPAPDPAAEAVPMEKAEPVRSAEAPRITVARAATSEADPCAAEPTPADRQICGDEALRRLQLELREAYAEALDAHADRALLRQRQLAWRSARDPVSDPIRLAQLYEQRIRKLHAATAEARQQP